jgi:thiamine-phosphate pyrophosphorylase
VAPDKFELGAFTRQLALALDAGDVASFLLRLDGPGVLCTPGVTPRAAAPPGDDAVRRAAHALLPVAHAHDVAFLIADRPQLAAELGADGVHLDAGDADFAGARRLLGANRIVGVNGRDSRHLAIEAAENGADYVALAADPDLIAWWSELMVVPGVAMGDVTLANCAALAAAGADFIAAGAGVWDDPAGPAAAVRDFNAAIAKVLAD